MDRADFPRNLRGSSRQKERSIPSLAKALAGRTWMGTATATLLWQTRSIIPTRILRASRGRCMCSRGGPKAGLAPQVGLWLELDTEGSSEGTQRVGATLTATAMMISRLVLLAR